MTHKRIYEFRVSKYMKDPKTGMPIVDEWTSISDVGKLYNGKLFTYSEYVQAESRYLQLIELVCSTLNIDHLQISSIENPFDICPYPNNHLLKNLDMIVNVAKDCLREKYWCKLQTDGLFFHFGYDYYLYIGSPLDHIQMNKIVSSVGLFLEEMNSPYKTG